jgi:hypothetical protein
MLNGHSSLLKNALFVDSAVSFITGIAFLLFSKAITGFLGMSTAWIIPVVGVVALIYSVEIFLAARAEPVNTGIAKVAVYGNLVWVLASAVLIFANVVSFTTAGKWVIAISADIVLVLAIAQYMGMKRLVNR